MKKTFSILFYILMVTLTTLLSFILSNCSSDVDQNVSPILSGYTLNLESKLTDSSINIRYEPKIFDSVIRLVITNQRNHTSSCTGSVVSHNTVLTSAHCLNSTIKNIVGFNTYPNGSLKGLQHKAKAFYSNLEYKFLLNDVGAVVFEDGSFKDFLEVYPGYLDSKENISIFKEDISQVTNVSEEDIKKHEAIFVGYGSQEVQEDKFYSMVKKVGKVLVSFQDPLTIRSSTDKSVNPNSSFNTFNMSEPGDSGGPLLYKGKLVGITMATHNTEKYSMWSYINNYENRISKYFNTTNTTSEKIEKNNNWNFLTKELDNQALISGVNAGIRTVELDGKIKVIQKYRVNTDVDPQVKNINESESFSMIPTRYRINSEILYYSPSKILSDNSTLKVGDIIVGYMSVAGVLLYTPNSTKPGFSIGSFVKQVLNSTSYNERKKLPWIVIENVDDIPTYVVRSNIALDIDPPRG